MTASDRTSGTTAGQDDPWSVPPPACPCCGNELDPFDVGLCASCQLHEADRP